MASFLNRVNNNIAIDQQSLEELKEQLVAPQQPDEPYYTLLIGSDSRESGDSGRSHRAPLRRPSPGGIARQDRRPAAGEKIPGQLGRTRSDQILGLPAVIIGA